MFISCYISENNRGWSGNTGKNIFWPKLQNTRTCTKPNTLHKYFMKGQAT